MNYRNLTLSEIDNLHKQHCSADNWNNVLVSEGFSTEHIQDVQFSGDIKLGAFTREFDQPGGYKVHSGIYHTRLHNVVVEDDVYIDRIGNYVANYKIGHDTFIENTNLIVVDGETSFGNGVEVPVLNETGGRNVLIYNELSAHLAYILTLYRHSNKLIANINKLISQYAEEKKSTFGEIGPHVKIVNCGTIKNTYVGEYASLLGVSKTSNGSINSTKESPTHIGSGVKCTDFIVSSDVSISDSTLISKCFVGQGCELGKHYSALDSLFFANCQGFHGEATAIFAGPYTVTHHKSTLLIAGMYSFLNAGSGSNQSNHMYKLGPIHQGVVGRGSKTTSDSYILWPSRIGAFTLVMGRHTKHSDTSDLPFSYLIENATDSYLVPGVNIKSVGTIRDAQKWPKRDKRKGLNKIDQINFNLLSPDTIDKMYSGITVLENLQTIAGETTEEYAYQNCIIRNNSLKNGLKFYKLAICKFLGNSLISRIGKVEFSNIEELRRALIPTSNIGKGKWVDMSGLIAPKSEIDNLLYDIENGSLSLKDIQNRFVMMHNKYYDYEWTWAYDKLMRSWGKPIEDITLEDLIDTVEKWTESVVTLDELLYKDAKKEFDEVSHIGFGIDGDEARKRLDFENVRGSFEDNGFVNDCLNHIEEKRSLGERTKERLMAI